MNRYTLILTFLLSLSLLSGCDSGSMSDETIDYGELIERDGLFYKKFTDIPYTGKVSGERQGSMRNGKEEGEWKFYYGDNALKAKGTYKQGKQNGNFTIYHDNSQILYQGNYLKGKKEGQFNFYYKNGAINKQKSGDT